MFGRDWCPFDRGPSVLWPLIMLFFKLLCETHPMESFCVVFLLMLVKKLLTELLSWRAHWILADLISDWNRAALKAKMKKAGIKPRPQPLPPPLAVLPCRWMVLSAVMMSMWSVAMAGPVPLVPPVTWVEAFGRVRALDYPPLRVTKPPRKPPDPRPFALHPSVNGEGEGAVAEKIVNPLSAEDAAEVAGFDVLTGVPFCLPCDQWADAGDHVGNAPLMGLVHQFTRTFGTLGLLAAAPGTGTAIVDTGASLTITPHREDFVAYEPVEGQVLKGLSAGATVQGRGIVHWKLEVGDKLVDIHLRALHVPETDGRLLCPQQLIQEHKPPLPPGRIEKHCVRLDFPEGVLECAYNSSNLPVVTVQPPAELEDDLKAMNSCVTMEANQNLSVAQKELLKWHCKLGHLEFKRIQNLMRSGGLGFGPKISAASKVDLNKDPIICGSCAFGKAKRRSATHTRRGKTEAAAVPVDEKLLSKEVLIPGQKVSMDHFIVTTPGRLFQSKGSESQDRMFKGGVIFVDHASGFVFVVPVVNFTAGEALRAKREFEAEMSSMGVAVLNYHTDNGVFSASQFQDKLAEDGQDMTFSGVGAHHQNAVAERAIGTVVNIARTMMLHAKMRWPKAVKTNLWPMAMKHAEFIVNRVPRLNNVCALDVVMKTVVPRHSLQQLHVWGAPCYVLEPKLQDGHKIPKFNPRSRRGLHLGWSPKHAASVPFVLNLTTGHVSPQFHVVFDDWFTTVTTESQDEEDSVESPEWANLLLNQRMQVHFDAADDVELDDQWLTEMERLERHEKASARVRAANPLPTVLDDAAPERNAPVNEMPQAPGNPTAPPAVPVSPPPPIPSEANQQRETVPPAAPPRGGNSPVSPKQRERPQLSPMKLRERSKSQKTVGFYKQMMNRLACGLLAVSNAPVLELAKLAIGSPAAHVALAGFDALTETFDCVDYLSYKALAKPKAKGKKGSDPDYPTFAQAMSGPDFQEWEAAMRTELETLIGMNTWTIVPRAEALAKGKRIIKSTWAFRQKRTPDGVPTKKKARLCVRGDTMQKDVDYFESYSPVVQWSSVRLMLILSIVHGLETRQVDYVNAFAQADLDKEVYLEIPQGFQHQNVMPCVLKLHKSLYGMNDAPLMFFELLKKNLLSVGFKQLVDIDPCLFVHKEAICLTYVDDCLWFGKDGAALDALINQMKGKMDLKVESNDVSDFLGIKFKRCTKSGTIELKQTGLIEKILEATGMSDCNKASVPADPKPLGKDVNGEPFEESWEYASVVGMMLYLSGNSRPDITFAVNQAARFTHDPKKSHGVAVKRIVRYLQGTKDRGLIFKPHTDWKVDCFVDADFCGLWGSEDPNDPVVTKSRTGYVILLAGCPLLWRSVLQTETSVSTMMAEYVALSSAMRELLPLKRLVRTVARIVTGDENVKIVTKSDVFEDNNGALTVATLPKITPQSKFFAVKLHFFREHVKTESNPDGEIHIQKIETVNQLADIMTKGLVEAKFVPLRDRLMGWDLDKETAQETNLHLRGSVENVSLVSSVGPSVLFALIVALDAPLLPATVYEKHQY